MADAIPAQSAPKSPTPATPATPKVVTQTAPAPAVAATNDFGFTVRKL